MRNIYPDTAQQLISQQTVASQTRVRQSTLQISTTPTCSKSQPSVVKQRLRLSVLGVCVSLTALMPLAYAQTETVNAAISEQVKTEEAARASQQRIANLDEEASRMLSEYRQVIGEARSLEIYNEQLQAQQQSQEEEMQGIARQLVEIETTSREVVPLMQRMLDTLENFSKLDMPFLVDERKARVDNLKDIMRRADVSISEKYRRVLEAYGVEMEYGRTIESYRAEMDDKGESLTVDFLRIGRVALLFQSLDGQRTGYWDKENARWVVDNSFDRSVRDGLRIAKQQAAPNLIVVPVAAAKEAQL